MNPANRLKTWLNRSLGHRLTLVSVATAVVLVVFLGLSTIPMFFHQAWQNFSGQSDNEIRRLTDQINLRLSVIEQNLSQLARNSFVVNSLVDSTGRELYLQPTLRDFRLSFNMASDVLVLDANLDPIGGSLHADGAMPAAVSLAKRAMEQQQPAMAIHEAGPEALAIVAIPIYYPAASAYEGVLIGSLKAADLFDGIGVADGGGCIAVTAGRLSLLRSGCSADARPGIVTQDLFAQSTLAKDIGLTIAYSKDRAPLFRYLATVLVAYLMIALVAIVGVYLVSRRVGGDLGRQLAWLGKAAQALAVDPSAPTQVVWDRPDEIGRFAEAFNTMVGSWQDLQLSLERRVVERTQELAASERNYASLAQAAPVGIFRTDAAGGWVYVNEFWCRMAGLSRDQAAGEGWLRAVHGEDREQVANAWAAALAERRSFSCEHRLNQDQESPLWVISQALAVEDEAGTLLGYVGTVTNISERKRSEETLRQAEERYRSVVENISEVVFQTDAEGRWSFLNRAWNDVTGFGVADSLGQHFWDYVHPDDREANLALFQALIARREDCCRQEVRYRHQDGGFRWIEVFARLTLDARDNVVGTSGTLTDITERRAVQKQLEHIAHYDGLTGLPNRVLLADRMQLALAQAKRANTLVGVCYLDLDGFKAVNDAYGHAAGDKLLVEVARRLTHTLRGGDTVARLGGDEFIALLPGLESVRQCEEVLQRTVHALSEPIHLDQGTVCVSASVGVSFYPVSADDGEILLRQADYAMYKAKQAGKNQYRLFNAAQENTGQLPAGPASTMPSGDSALPARTPLPAEN